MSTPITPNMNLLQPITGVTSGSEANDDFNANWTTLDQHNHSPGSGAQITPNGININSDLPFNNTNNAINLRSVRFAAQDSPLSGSGADIGCLYESGVDLYYNDGAGNQIRITQSGSVAGASGTITGLPSGTASAAYVSATGTFQFQQATSTAANLDVASVAIRYPGSYPTPSGNYIQIQAPSSLATGYAFTLPATLPASSGAFLTSDTSGAVSYTNVDNASLYINSAQIQLKPNSHAVTQGMLAARASTTNGADPGAGGVCQNTASATTSSTSFVSVSGSSCVLTTTGRPVRAVFNGTMSLSTTTNGVTAQIQLLRGSIPVQLWASSYTFASSANQSVKIPVSLECIDPQSSSAYTYSLKFSVGSGVYSITLDGVMTVYEI